MRAQRFVDLIEAGRAAEAEAILPVSIPNDSNLRRTVRLATQAKVQPLSPNDFFSFKRRVVAGGPMQFDHPRRVDEDILDVADFTVTWTSFLDGRRHFVPSK
jgi:hypothetical protein